MECQSGNLVEYLFLWIICVTSHSWHLSQVSWVEWDTNSKAALGTYLPVLDLGFRVYSSDFFLKKTSSSNFF
jgi:hypothetical protein